MINQTQAEEIKYLEKILVMINAAIEKESHSIDRQAEEIQAAKRYLWENIYELDPIEIAQNKDSISMDISTAESAVERKHRLSRLALSPYFARVDFIYDQDDEATPVYIGIYHFTDEENSGDNIIYDWRAPVSSLFYEFELGEAFYEAPLGKICGTINLKRQYKISLGQLDYMLESSVSIGDDILRQELSKASDDKMKNIVTTIQREQNLIIRNEKSNILIIQGVAGSGKTSIALHRVAYLLYNNKGLLTSQNILILSPNKVFSDYISNVLPELGERQILEVSFVEIARNELGKSFKFETFFDQVMRLVENKNIEEYRARVKFKSSMVFLEQLRKYIDHINSYFNANGVEIADTAMLDADFIQSRYSNYIKRPIIPRLHEVADDAIERIETHHNTKLSNKNKNAIKSNILKMFKTTDIMELYYGFFEWIGRPKMFVRSSVTEYADVFPLVYLKMFVSGSKNFQYIKHLIVDEMQDYTPIQYALLEEMFPCKKTILGDCKQSVNPLSSVTAEDIRAVCRGADIVELVKSYRSTKEIAEFGQSIISSEKMIIIHRHGDAPKIHQCKNSAEQEEAILEIIAGFERSGYQSLSIICKTQALVDALYNQLCQKDVNLAKLDNYTESYQNGIIVLTAHMAKGLEFDQVIVPFCDAETYHSDIDRQMMYIACTRAMHKLDLTCAGQLSGFLSQQT